jgi:hypothetical protein
MSLYLKKFTLNAKYLWIGGVVRDNYVGQPQVNNPPLDRRSILFGLSAFGYNPSAPLEISDREKSTTSPNALNIF